MKKSIYTFALVVFSVSTVLTSCSSPDEKVEDAQENVENASQDLDEAKEDYRNAYAKFQMDANETMTANEAGIVELKEKAKTVKKEEREDYERAIVVLEKRNEAMRARVRDYKDEGNEKWESFKREFKHDMDELNQSLKDLGKNNVK